MTSVRCLSALLILLPLGAYASSPQDSQTAGEQNDVVVTATRQEQHGFDLPVSIDAIDQKTIQEGQAQVNLSESLRDTPGITANTRQNYAQDLQVAIRGFGARSTFGIRGVRLYTDGVPLTMPDGQGQAANVDLSSARRIEVLRGPFSALYGNSSGGVINVMTGDAKEDLEWGSSAWTGSFDSHRFGLKLGGEEGKANYLLDASRFETRGYRDHSSAQRDTLNGKLNLTLGEGTRLTFIANYLNQPGTEDPLGLTRAQMQQNREQAGTGAIAQDTRKDIENEQLGVTLDHQVSPNDTLRVLGYYGGRTVRQYLALTFAGRGVVDLDRNFGGADVRWSRRVELAGQPLTFTTGANYDTMRELRKGFTNNAGVAGALGRDELNTVSDFDQYIQAQWDLGDRWSVSGGLRHSVVRFDTHDRFITPTNGDDSGSLDFTATTPVAGVLFKLRPDLSLYTSAGKAFETPTAAELAYDSVSATSTGWNRTLQPARSKQIEVGAKARAGAATRLNVALFRADTRDEIVVQINQGGRSVYQNAERTRRQGIELALEQDLGRGFGLDLAYTHLDAQFQRSFLTCGTSAACATPNLTVPSGNRIPGVPAETAAAELGWSRSPQGFSTALEARWVARVFTGDLNDEAAESYAVVNWRASLQQKFGGWNCSEFVRLDNLLDRQYSGSVIVNASNGQYYEPAPGRAVMLGVSLKR